MLSTQFRYLDEGVSAHQKQITSVQLITIMWMCAEAAVAVVAAIRAQSVALLAFGADSGIELLSATIVFLRFRNIAHLNEKRASRITGVLLFALAAFVLASSILAFSNPRFRPEPSYLGIGLFVAAGVFMPWLARQKRALAVKTNSGSLKSDAVQSSMCGYLAWIALGGLILNAVFKFSWADPAAALFLLPIVIREGWEAVQRRGCAECNG